MQLPRLRGAGYDWSDKTCIARLVQRTTKGEGVRGEIIMWNGERGVVAAAGRRYEFDINQWGEDFAPRSGLKVVLLVENDTLQMINSAPREGGPVKELSGLRSMASGKWREFILDAPVSVIMAYFVFVLCMISPIVVYARRFNAWEGYGLIGVVNDFDYKYFTLLGVIGFLLILLSSLSIAVPSLSKNRYAPLAWCVPLLVFLFATYRLFSIISRRAEHKELAKELFGEGSSQVLFLEKMGDLSIGPGLFLGGALALFLAIKGYRRFRAVSG